MKVSSKKLTLNFRIFFLSAPFSAPALLYLVHLLKVCLFIPSSFLCGHPHLAFTQVTCSCDKGVQGLFKIFYLFCFFFLMKTKVELPSLQTRSSFQLLRPTNEPHGGEVVHGQRQPVPVNMLRQTVCHVGYCTVSTRPLTASKYEHGGI